MSTADRLRVNNFDLLRLLAAIQVMVIHAIEHLHVPLGRAGQAIQMLLLYFPGVPIFFFISGFLIAASFERNDHLPSYARNRLLRIYPALWVCLAVSILSVAVFGYWWISGATLLSFGIWLLAQMSVVQFYNPDFLRGYGIGVLNGSLWTIGVELQFYVLLPVILRLLKRWPLQARNWVMVGLIGVGMLIDARVVEAMSTYGDYVAFKFLSVTIMPYLHMFLVGILVQQNFARLLPWLEGRALVWLALYLVCAISLHKTLSFRPGSVHPNAMTVVLLSAAMASCAFSWPSLSHRLLRGNDISYGTYIYHMIVINAAVELGLRGSLLWLVIVCALTMMCAAASWVWVEKSALRRKKAPSRMVQA